MWALIELAWTPVGLGPNLLIDDVLGLILTEAVGSSGSFELPLDSFQTDRPIIGPGRTRWDSVQIDWLIECCD